MTRGGRSRRSPGSCSAHPTRLGSCGPARWNVCNSKWDPAMIPANPDEREDSFIELLAAADEALAAGETPRFSDGDPDLRDRLERGMACMRILRERRSTLKSALAPLEHLPDSLGRIGRFEIKRELGRGGFGVVFLAYDTHLNRDVALKVPRADAFVTPELRERFQREA